MTTGDQALPQPPETEAPPAIPAPPRVVLEREALLRSFRWVFVVKLVHTLVAIGFQVYAYKMTVFFLGYYPWEHFWSSIAYRWGGLCLDLTQSGVMFYLLSRPQRRAGAVFAGFLAIELPLYATLVWVGLFPTDGWTWAMIPVILQDVIVPVMFLLTSVALVALAFTGPGRKVYVREGVAYFQQEDAVRLRERYWLGVAYFLAVFGQMAFMWLF
jgi:hypothetical protein